jgi:hypothetical protein
MNTYAMKSICHGRWRLKDGSLLEDLDAIDLERIRDACNQQCITRWTSIATRERLYQFLAMSDKETQVAMRLKLTANHDQRMGCSRPCSNNRTEGFSVLDHTPGPRGTKRCGPF